MQTFIGQPGRKDRCQGAQYSPMAISNQLEDLLLLWRHERSRGVLLSPEELCKDHPELLTELRERIRGLGPTDESPTVPPPLERGPSAPFSYLRPATESGILGHLGPFRVLKQIGEGGMGCVFLADDPIAQRR